MPGNAATRYLNDVILFNLKGDKISWDEVRAAQAIQTQSSKRCIARMMNFPFITKDLETFFTLMLNDELLRARIVFKVNDKPGAKEFVKDSVTNFMVPSFRDDNPKNLSKENFWKDLDMKIWAAMRIKEFLNLPQTWEEIHARLDPRSGHLGLIDTNWPTQIWDEDWAKKIRAKPEDQPAKIVVNAKHSDGGTGVDAIMG